MIHCILNLYDEKLRITVADLDAVGFTFKMFYEDCAIRRCYRELSRSEVHTGRFREWDRETTEESYADFQRLRTVVDRHIPVVDHTIRVTQSAAYTYITRDRVQLAISNNSSRRQTGEFQRFPMGCVFAGPTATKDFCILEDSISTTCDYDSCYSIEPDAMPTDSFARRMAEGSVFV